ncbi:MULTISPECIES: capsular biosynthesis protein [unclassified Rhizobium]|uniref:capsule biosynthesis protein n=1 Tax=unclassified Rhizobium TaxID=2613769 RepID=UPI000EA8B2BC|nr:MULTISPECIES: capsular biosynthesis protein [unclassified Rhizobium]AYG65834.1 capsular biosynthesis protein [Rhizobium sp. CCGE531]AYG72315.1 capsular biosynthesis protein [Rhizobium sp. CCGE532]
MADGQGKRGEGESPRTFLFLQGPSSPLFIEIARILGMAGSRCVRINLNAGDWISWRRRNAFNYRGNFVGWRAYVRRRIEAENITDMILHGEERPYHQVAIEEARRLGVGINVVEMGYLRPDWVTLERDGLSSNSHFPDDPAYILKAAFNLPDPDWTRRYSQTFLAEALYDLVYYLPTVFLWFLYPGYRRHGLYHPLVEYAGWLRRLPSSGRRSRQAEGVIEDLIASGKRFFVYPLQLQTDFQLRAHSPFHQQQDAIRLILRSLAENATPETHLVLKLHPLDNGLVDWRACADGIGASCGLSSRVHFMDGGDLDRLTAGSQGMVTVNSTAALSALRAGKPVKALGAAVYDIEGLSDRGTLDRFWHEPRPPSPELRDAFFRLLAAAIQVRGNFCSGEGAHAAAAEIAGRLLSRTVNLPDGYVDPPPRQRPSKMHVP